MGSRMNEVGCFSVTEYLLRQSPPFRLLDFPPLAFLMNSYLSILNELRVCAPLTLQNDVLKFRHDLYSFHLLLKGFTDFFVRNR